MSLPLQLESHFFTKVEVEANSAYRPSDDQRVGIHTEVELAQHKDDNRRWQVVLNLRVEPADGKIPYKINLQVIGLFRVGPEVEEKKMPFLVHANGAAMLYSSAREFLLIITGRGPWDAFYLPTTNFLEHPKPKEEEGQHGPPSLKVSKRKKKAASVKS